MFKTLIRQVKLFLSIVHVMGERNAGMIPSCSGVFSSSCIFPLQITLQQRGHAKRLAYGLLYGMGSGALASELGTTSAEAAQLADTFRRSMPGVDAWLKQVGEGMPIMILCLAPHHSTINLV